LDDVRKSVIYDFMGWSSGSVLFKGMKASRKAGKSK
jgi:hypothetical protein